MNKNIKITVIGAGNGGQAIAADCAIRGYNVCLYNRTISKIQSVFKNKTIKLTGAINGDGYIDKITDDIEDAVQFGDIIFIVTTATAHRELAKKMAPYLMDNQIIVLTPGRTGGALEFEYVIAGYGLKSKVYVCETQTLMYACRKISESIVNIIGVKDKVLYSMVNHKNNEIIHKTLNSIFPSLIPADNVMQTSLENIGAMFHPAIILFNAASIERGSMFYFYRDLTDSIASFIQKLDNIRIEIGKAYGISLISASDWVSYAYPNISGDTLCERIKNNPAYYDILAPNSIYSRQILEDIPTGIIPMAEFGRVAGVNVALFDSFVDICSNLLNIDLKKDSRTLSSIGLEGFDYKDIKNNIIL